MSTNRRNEAIAGTVGALAVIGGGYLAYYSPWEKNEREVNEEYHSAQNQLRELQREYEQSLDAGDVERALEIHREYLQIKLFGVPDYINSEFIDDVGEVLVPLGILLVVLAPAFNHVSFKRRKSS